MTQKTDKNPGETKPGVIESGWGTFLFVWVKAIAITAVAVFILKYIFRVPIAI